jgi:hypothetical protein
MAQPNPYHFISTALRRVGASVTAVLNALQTLPAYIVIVGPQFGILANAPNNPVLALQMAANHQIILNQMAANSLEMRAWQVSLIDELV